MQSYKIKKMTETSMFPIEYELRQIHEENSSNWFKLMWQLISVVFSGIAVTLLCQKDYIPSLFDLIAEELSFPIWLKYLCEVFFILLLFVLLVTITFAIIKYKIKVKDNKASEEDRIRLAEFFHKVIFNNITTGRSFLKKASNCPDDEKELYLCESIYYFNLSYKDILSKKILEIGKREKYELFLKEVGKNTLKNTISIFQESIKTLKSLLPEEEKKIAEEIYKDILLWKI